MSTVVRFEDWVDSHGPDGITEFDDFFRGVAEARYVVRRVTRIVDEQARNHGLDPLEHQLLIQLFGAPEHARGVSQLALRLDVPSAVASRLVKRLEGSGHVARSKSDGDRRVTIVTLTDPGRQACVEIWEDVRFHVDYFQRQLDDESKQVALAVFGFYVGVALDFIG